MKKSEEHWGYRKHVHDHFKKDVDQMAYKLGYTVFEEDGEIKITDGKEVEIVYQEGDCHEINKWWWVYMKLKDNYYGAGFKLIW